MADKLGDELDGERENGRRRMMIPSSATPSISAASFGGFFSHPSALDRGFYFNFFLKKFLLTSNNVHRRVGTKRRSRDSSSGVREGIGVWHGPLAGSDVHCDKN